MTQGGSTLPAAGGEPGIRSDGVAPSGVPWYRRRAVVVGAVVAVVLAITVVTDLPHPTSRPQEIADESTVIGEINTDASPCTFAVKESFSIYGDVTAGTLSASNRAEIPGLLADDQSACSFTDSSIFDLSNIEVPGSAAGRDIGDMVLTVTDWASSDAVAAIQQIETLAGDPGNGKARSALGADEKLLASDRASAMKELQAADQVLDAHLPAPALPVLPVPAATG
jgi:hypothetical protein